MYFYRHFRILPLSRLGAKFVIPFVLSLSPESAEE